jgi:histidinol-phosphate aminotransferase
MLRAREAVIRMKGYHPPLSGRTGLRLDFNENTSGCSPRVLAKLKQICEDDLARYPERGPTEDMVAAFLSVPSSQLLLTNGVDEAVHLLCETYLQPGDEVIIPTPTFGMYELYAQQTGAEVIKVQADPDFAFPTEAVLQALSERTRLITIASPNNPTGAVISKEDLTKILINAPHCAVLLDEAYFDFYGITMLPEIARFPNLFIARTFSKAYGLAAFRVGVLMGPSEEMRFVRKVSSPYNVNGMALACLNEALQDDGFVRQYVADVLEGRQRVMDRLASLSLRSWPSCANFILVRIGDKRLEFVGAMRAKGILVRDRHTDPGCEGCVRITIGTNEHTDLLIKALDEFCISRELSGASSAREVDS